MTMNFSCRHVAPTVLAALAVAPHLPAQAPGERFPLTGATVAAALQTSGLTITTSAVEMPPSLTAKAVSPTLRITHAELLDQGHMRVRFVCSVAGECLPFFAIVNLPARQDAIVRIADLNAGFQEQAPLKPSGPALRAGAAATLLMGDEHMRVALPVISIDSGALGSAVRVCTPDHKHIFKATVLSTDLVKGDLP